MNSFIDKLFKKLGYEKITSTPVMTEGIKAVKLLDVKEVENKYRVRIQNLEKEATELMDKVRKLELDTEKTKTEKKALTNYAIRRLTSIRNEIEIREEVLNGFNSKCIR